MRARLRQLRFAAGLGAMALAAAACAVEAQRAGFDPEGTPDAGASLPDAAAPEGSAPEPEQRDPFDPTDEPVSCVSGSPCAVQLVAGRAHFCALVQDGTVRCWGDDTLGSVGEPARGDAGGPTFRVTSSMNRRTLQIVASDDDTIVSMRPSVAIGGGADVLPGLTGEAVSWTLARGQVLQISQLASPAGSPISSNKPIGVFGGSPCTFIPAETPYCDLTQQQIAPFSQWGTEYALVPYRSRLDGLETVSREVVPWSFVGAANGTVLTYDPAKPPGAPVTLSAGQIASFETDALVTVRSQDSKHPFHVSVYMTGSRNGGGTAGGGHTTGDPDFVNIVPSDQFLDRYVFFADYTFPDTSLTVVRRRTKDGFRPVRLACGGEITGWAPLGGAGEYEYAWVNLTTGFAPQTFTMGTCGYGRHEAESDGPFSVMVWGTGIDASYGYAGGAGSRPINDAPLPDVK